MPSYTVAENQKDFRANLGTEIIAASPEAAAERYCVIEGILPDYVWVAGEGDNTGREIPTP